MIRGLFVLALGGAFISTLCFTVAASRGSMEWDGLSLFAAHRVDPGPVKTRVIPWVGGSELTLNLPARIIIHQGPTASISVVGTVALIDHITLIGNEISLDRSVSHWSWPQHDDKLTINVTAPALDKIVINGFGTLELKDWHRENLALVINGAATVKGEGRAENVDLTIDGAATAKFTEMAILNLKVTMDGAGSVKAGPTGRANVSISGAGSVKLTRIPTSLSENISGVGSVSVPHDGESKVKAHASPKYSSNDNEELSL
ncbi:GIN domain-containing protein [Kozakia baliensis]|uniref:Uncharacterized protein n=1 Tax=Kozakia baliensis TaxID=153496 RepID=A0A1D8UZ29_9PROT|nr:DUF2807 domain-containing protein [Kozakia baliensis]AOX18832.1 hypothetical protein A0U89_16220 [Kozakia baliensis]GBR32747.1 hypothetical protein AA0488_2615 [Kozakia baliensis NRIC 0488]GEL65525.1 hypothetical protein KBA01_28110 [Kozakia baliensis]